MEKTEKKSRGQWGSGIGFVLAAAGSAVGLGNIWRFPYLAAKYGGGIFLLVYVVLVITFGVFLMITEIAIGRKTGLSPIGAYTKLGKKFKFVGVIASFVAFFILPYYSVIGGWVMKYFASYIGNQHTALADSNFFSSFISSGAEPIIWQVIFILLTTAVVIFGVEKGIEKASKILMPLLFLLLVGLAVYSATRPGALDGIAFYFKPDFSKFSMNLVLAAMGQMFYSMSLAMGIMITFGSYVKKDENIETSSLSIALFDTIVAIIAGFIIVPSFYIFSGGHAESMNAGPGLMFGVLPQIFEGFGSSTVTTIFGAVFFLLVFFAAITSAISLMEAVVSTISDQLKINRKLSTFIASACAILISFLPSLGYSALSNVKIIGLDILDFMDFITNAVLMPIGALLTCIIVGYFLTPKTIIDEVRISSPFKPAKLYTIVIRYFGPAIVIAVLVSSVLNTFGIIKL